MIEILKDNIDQSLIAPCGFYCGSCPTYIRGDCKGCYHGGAGKCFTYKCVQSKGLNFCGECSDFPCKTILNGEKNTIFNKEWLEWKKRELNK